MSKNNRPYWQTASCPAWCSGNHSKSDSGTDRQHASRWSKRLVLTTMDTIRTAFTNPDKVYYEPTTAVVYLNQGIRETEPRVIIEDGNGRFELDLTLDEARRLTAGLTKAVDLAEGAE